MDVKEQRRKAKRFLQRNRFRYGKLTIFNDDYKKVKLYKNIVKALEVVGLHKDTPIDLWTTMIRETENVNRTLSR